MKLIPYGRQYIDNEDIKSLSRSLKQNKITTGPKIKEFEKKINIYLKSKYSLVCNSGTSAIFLALRAIDLKKGDTIIMPSINFISSYNVSKMLGARIYLADVDPYTGQITPKTIEECCKKFNLKRVKAVIVMYNGGYPQNVEKFIKLKKKFNFKIIEDACHALGAEYICKNKKLKVGSCKHSDVCTFSFHPLKTITTGEGGAVTTNSKKIYDKMEKIRSHGIKRQRDHWKYDIVDLGLNFRLTDIQCALGISQLKKINNFLLKRKKISEIYEKKLRKLNLIKLIKKSKNYISSNHLFLIHIKNFTQKKKEKLIKFMFKNNIILQYHYIPIYKFKVYSGKNIRKNSETYFNNTVSLPIYYSLSVKEQNYIIRKIKSFFNKK